MDGSPARCTANIAAVHASSKKLIFHNQQNVDNNKCIEVPLTLLTADLHRKVYKRRTGSLTFTANISC